MPDLLSAGARWLEQQRDQHLSRMVLYRRGVIERSVRATVGRTLFEVATAGGVIERVESRDFLIPVAALAGLSPPVRGDRVIEVSGTIRHLHEVLAPGREPPWRWSDPNRLLYRIHTKFLQSETVP